MLSFTVVGSLVLLFWACEPGDEGPNRYNVSA